MNKFSLNFVVFAIIGILLFSGVSFGVTQSFSLMVLTQEKTVFVEDEDIKDLVDFNYEVQEDVTIVEEETENQPFIAYRGNLIEGKITVKSINSTLDKSFEKDSSVNIRYYLLVDKQITQYDFENCKITDMTVDNNSAETTYSFKASSLKEKKV